MSELVKIGRVWLDPDRVDAVSPHNVNHAHIILSSGHTIEMELGVARPFATVEALAAEINAHRTEKQESSNVT